jgi:hypothetical protein
MTAHLTAARRSVALLSAYAAVSLLALIISVYVARHEGGVREILFTLAVLSISVAIVTLLTRRLLFAMVVVAVLVALIYIVAHLKQQTTDVTLHAYDMVAVATTKGALRDLWRNHTSSASCILLVLIATTVISFGIYLIDSTQIRRRYALFAVPIFACVAAITANPQDARRHMGFYYESRHLWFFLSSWRETGEALWRGHLIEAASQQQLPKFKTSQQCEPTSKPPHIILIHQESVVPPSHFANLTYDRALDRFFHSHDGQLHKLRVETYGGASWLTEFSVLTGLSTVSMGNLRQFAQTIMARKVRETLPQALARCGYRNVAFHPMLWIYLSIGNFLEAVGIDKVFDAKEQGAKSATERDRFYYTSALTEMEDHFRKTSQPLFVFIETMATHGPYSYAYQPEVDVPGGGPGTDPAMHEYLRRLSMAATDYDYFAAELARRFPDQQFLIVHYGDHQPTATRTLLGFDTKVDIESVLKSGNPAALITYFAINGVRYEPTLIPSVEALDVPYLPAVLLASAGLPLPEVYRERLRLLRACRGRYQGCPEIPAFHRRMIESGIVDAR